MSAKASPGTSSEFLVPKTKCVLHITSNAKTLALLILLITYMRPLSAEADDEGTSDVNILLNDLVDNHSQTDSDQGELKRLWGVRDATASVGRVFNYSIPSDAFTGKWKEMQVSEAGEQSLPSWLTFDPHTLIFLGVPLEQDLGQQYISVKAVGKHDGKLATAVDVFSIEVIEQPQELNALADYDTTMLKCSSGDPLTIATVILDVALDDLKAAERVSLLSNASSILKIAIHQLQLNQLKPESQSFDSSAIMAGPGNAKKQHTSGASIQWQVGCSGTISPELKEVISDLEKAAEEGSLADRLGVPVCGWKVTNVFHRASRKEKRQLSHLHGTPVPAAVPTHWPHFTHNVDEMDATEDSATPESRVVPTMASPIYTQPSHHHRHHHGEERGHYRPVQESGHLTASPTLHHYHLPNAVITPLPTPVQVPSRPTKYLPPVSVDLGPSRYFPEEHTLVEEIMPSMTSPIQTATETEALPSRSFIASSDSETSADIKPTKSGVPLTPTKKPAVIPNFKPTIHSRMKKLSMIAGKVWRYQIPRDTFIDVEDGDTSNLKLIFLSSERTSIPSNSWVQLDPEKQTLYALPLEENIGKYEFILEAMDSEGASTHDIIQIHVWQHQSARALHHEFSLTLRYNKWQYPISIEWRIEVVKKLARYFGDKDESLITVQSVSPDPITITWSNDSLPAYPCPNEEISELANRLTDEKGEVSRQFRKAMSTEFRVLDVTVNFLGVCRSPISTTSSTHTNFAPMIRNAIEQINTTVGEILRFKVPDDTFYDFEDGSTRYLTLTFLTIDNIRPPKSSWVQFDPKSQELYGLPFESDTGRYEFQLVAMDSNGLQVNDAFVIVVHSRPPKKWSVEFSLHLDHDFDEFNRDISKKVLVAWKLAKLYGDPDPRFITVSSISKGSVVYAWTNNTLPHDPCPKAKITRLVKYIYNENKTMPGRLIDAMLPEFRVIKADAMPLGICLGELTPTSVTVTPPPAIQEAPPAATSDDDIYITTIIPAIVIAAMLIIAAMVACFLYRKKRKGKMTMQDTSGFTNKRIPVIFSDELDEKTDAAKPPVIMKDEKPPLAPVEYLRSSASSHDSTPQLECSEPANVHNPNTDHNADPNSSPPYQPPPPFTTNRDNKNARPKVIQTYRQPPPYAPYVPP